MKVFATGIGQIDNVGDTVLRRGFLDALRPLGDLQVFVGTRETTYTSGLGLADTDVLFTSAEQWRREVSRTALCEPTVYAFNAGEMELRRRYAMHYVRLAPLLLASRLRGGHSVHVGVGVRQDSVWKYPVALTLRLADLVSWRDPMSRAMMGIGRVAPDWAFALGASDDVLAAGSEPAERPVLAVSVRYDVPRPDATWVRSVRALADSLGLQVVTVTQIERDSPLAEELATELGGEALLWEGKDHKSHEARLRAVYRRSRFVLSDRLHAHVIALTEGALPLVLADSDEAKAARSLAAASIAGVTVGTRLDDPIALERTALDVLSRRDPIMRHVVDARATLRDLSGDLLALTSRATTSRATTS